MQNIEGGRAGGGTDREPGVSLYISLSEVIQKQGGFDMKTVGMLHCTANTLSFLF